MNSRIDSSHDLAAQIKQAASVPELKASAARIDVLVARLHLDGMPIDRIAGDDLLLARFAAPADLFEESGSWWSWLMTRRDERALDLKKLGSFPIVHGVRALTLPHGVQALGTVRRLDALAERGALDAAMARELIDALHVLMALKLDHQLRQRKQGRPADNLLRPSEMASVLRGQLNSALAGVRRFRAFRRRHFRLEAL